MSTPLHGIRALVTSGPTFEPIDPVRFLGNRSSGKQGHAIAEALAAAGAHVTLITGPVSLTDPEGVSTIHIQTAREMLDACNSALPVDVAICAAAVADWRPVHVSQNKMKKTGGSPPTIELTENPDILRTLSHLQANRPKLVIGFAAETENVHTNAAAKRLRKGCDWIIANDVSSGQGFDSEENTVTLIDANGATPWPHMTKRRIAQQLAQRIADHFGGI